MANENTIKTRIQLKCDTEENWNKSALIADGGTKEEGETFIPKKGEAIIYSTDGTHPFSRFKVGDGIHSVPQLPFIGSHNINNIILEETYNDLPSIGDINMLYVVIDTLTVYKWSQGNFIKLYSFNRQQITSIANWDAGIMTELSVYAGVLDVLNGTIPTLETIKTNVLTDFS